jgi:hypothetical protein
MLWLSAIVVYLAAPMISQQQPSTGLADEGCMTTLWQLVSYLLASIVATDSYVSW